MEKKHSRCFVLLTCIVLSATISGCSGEGLTGRLQNLINDVVQQVAEAGGVAEAVDAATGGTVSDPEKGVEVVVPAGALPEPAEGDAWVVAIKPYSDPAPEDPESYEAVGEIVDISIVSALNGTAAKLLAAINITVPYGSSVNEGDVDRLAVGNYHDGTWITAQAEQVDTERRRVTAKFSQLSPFRAMLATASGATANATPVATAAQFSVNEDAPLTGQLSGSDADGDTLSFELVDDVAHGTVTVENSGAFTYRPVANYNGADSFTFRVSDGTATSATATVSIAVTAVNDAPVANAAAFGVNEDGTLNGQLSGSDVDGDALTFAVVNDVTQGTLSLNTNGSFTYNPTADYNGADSFTFRVSDGTVNSSAALVSIAVTAVNDAPAANVAAFGVNEDGTLNGQLSGSDVDGDTLTFAVVNDVTQGTLSLNTNGSFTYSPSANFNGADSFTFRVNDGTADSAAALVSIAVTAVNDAPVANAAAFGVNEDGTLNGQLSGSDVDGDALTFAVVNDVTQGTLSLNTNGSFTYNPTADYNGADSFTFRVSDGTVNSSAALVSIAVTAVNDAPMLSGPGPLATTSPAPVSGLLTASDVDGDPLTFGVFTSPTSGAAAVTAVSGTMAEVWYTPIAGNTGNDTFWVSVSDGTAEVTAAVTVFVEFPPFVRYVSAVASGLADGSSWADATDVIQDAVDAAAANGGGQVWIASGTWYTTDTTPLLTMADGVDVYGGFSGFEQSVDERGQVNPFLTVLSGDSDLSTTHSTGDAYHVVVAANATLDGLTITGGNAVGNSNDQYGGGILSIGKSLAVHNVVIRDSYATLYGGAIYQNGGSLDLDRVRLEGSQSGSAGGALYSQSGVGLTIARSALYGNQTGFGGGGGIYLYQTDMDMFDVTLDGNSSSGTGGAASFSFDNIVQMVNVQFSGNSGGSAGALSLSSSGPVTAVNVHFVGNSSTQFNGGAIQISSSSLDLRNVTFWQNTSTGAGPDVYLAGGASLGADDSCTQTNLSAYGSNNTQIVASPFTTPAASGELFFEQSHLCADWGDNATATTAFAAAGTDWTWWTSDISNMTTEFDSGTVAAGRLFHPADVWIDAFSASASLLSWTTNDQATDCAITNSADATVIPLGPIDFPSGSTGHTLASGTVVTLNCLSPVAYSKSATAVVP